MTFMGQNSIDGPPPNLFTMPKPDVVVVEVADESETEHRTSVRTLSNELPLVVQKNMRTIS